jgi:hypothetical protein
MQCQEVLALTPQHVPEVVLESKGSKVNVTRQSQYCNSRACLGSPHAVEMIRSEFPNAQRRASSRGCVQCKKYTEIFALYCQFSLPYRQTPGAASLAFYSPVPANCKIQNSCKEPVHYLDVPLVSKQPSQTKTFIDPIIARPAARPRIIPHHCNNSTAKNFFVVSR